MLYQQPVASEHTLQEHYWTHVEFYPHRPVAKHLRQELLSVLRHAQAGK